MEEAFCYAPNSEMLLSSIATLEGNETDPLEGIQISIGQNYNSLTDTLIYNEVAGITGQFDSQNGVFDLKGQATVGDYRLALENLYFKSTTITLDSKTIDLSLSNLDFLVTNGHFYQFFAEAGISWTDAKNKAAQKDFFGLKGYLATITTTEENNFILNRVSGTAWIGASDNQQEGTWRWVTGPEALENGGLGKLVNPGFTNWNSGEPNNTGGDEDYAHMMDWSSPPGKWNDLPDVGGDGQYAPTGYIVEYGGQAGEPDIVGSISGTTILDIKSEIDISGPVSVCPNLEGVVYTAQNIEGYSYNWTVEGGTIVEGQGTHEITIDWGDTNPDAQVSLQAVSDIYCEIGLDYAVKINEKLEPLVPSGYDMICYNDLSDIYIYTAIESPGSSYTWHITNGTIQSRNGTSEIQVQWNSPGIGTLYFTESTSTATDVCDGDSPILEVDIREEVQFDLVTGNVSCYGGNDGTAQVNITQGASPLSYEWVTGGKGTPNNNEISDLPAGSYSVNINSDGCIVEATFVITEPTALAGTVTPTDVLCFGESSGTALAEITGGTGSYTYNWSNGAANQAFATGFSKGTYSVEVVDENNCSLTINFQIGEPDLLVIDSIASTLVSCPGGNDGTLEAFVSGGTPPYLYTWEGSTDQTALATGFPQGEFSVIVTDANGCTVESSQTVEETIPKVYMPTAFTPNGDDQNDTFGPTTTCDFEFSMLIYNRWGTIVFSSTSPTEKWDGTYNGQPAPIGTYSYMAAWKLQVNDHLIDEERTGKIELIR